MKLVELETKEEYEALTKTFDSYPFLTIKYHFLGAKKNDAGEWVWIENGSKLSYEIELKDYFLSDKRSLCRALQYSRIDRQYYVYDCNDRVRQVICEEEEVFAESLETTDSTV
jgi:hypothetical protein